MLTSATEQLRCGGVGTCSCRSDRIWVIEAGSTERGGTSAVPGRTRCTSRGFSVTGRSASTTRGPMVMLGTKRPSMTSTWIQSHPASSMALTCIHARVWVCYLVVALVEHAAWCTWR